jgi:hypothetical protein
MSAMKPALSIDGSDATTTNQELDDELTELSKSYNDLLFLKTYSTLLSTSKQSAPVSDSMRSISKDLLIEVGKANDVSEIESLDLSSRGLVEFKTNGSFQPQDLVALTSLNLSSNRIMNLTSIVYFFSVKTLDLSNNQLTSLVGIDSLPRLKELTIDGNLLTGLKPLDECPSIKRLSAQRNRFENIDELVLTLKSMKSLKELSVQGNPCSLDYFSKYEFIVQLPHLQTFDGKRLTETDLDVARKFYRHFTNLEERNNESNGHANHSDDLMMTRSDTFTKGQFASKLRNLAKTEKRMQLPQPKQAHPISDFRKKKEPEEIQVNKHNIPPVIKIENGSLKINSEIDELKNALKSRDEEIDKLKYENASLQLENKSIEILLSRNSELEAKILQLETMPVPKANSLCKSSDCKETINALNKRVIALMDELKALRAPPSFSQSEIRIQSGYNATNSAEFQGIVDESELDLEASIERSLMETLGKIGEAKSMLKSLKSEKPLTIKTEKIPELRTEVPPVKPPIKRTLSLLKNKFAQSMKTEKKLK